ncbi:ATP-binding cassette domain-containing protein [Oceanimonas sp. NS1]|uniref:Arginine transport ATP-binding protein ArtP n=1 Tax=Oceanimonas doudoroffii TaxID=84158 RepID=A0A233RJK2_9GAMM|nr:MULTISPECIES: ATP-binding cassette domain-containing protein [Oceanimonas]MCT7653871.1 ATP-binding cassette domain-containing protein [Oceanimonas sp. NS1]NHH99844.1 Arginine transport ATP-binding protein ArtP [Oceanimonas sp. MB9]OXY83567.1 arginine ABC transporter ATP-binding protein ArtP [Oceanimonas doudoroffii]
MGIEFSGISKSWAGQEILSQVSLQCDAGETLVLLGPSGAGKSSLLRLMNLLDVPDAGTLAMAGEQFSFPADDNGRLARRAQELRRKVGMVFQQYHLWPHLTVEQNLLEAPLKVLGMNKAEARDKAAGLLAQLKLADKRQAWPGALSGGQQQRVAIARALMMNPEVLLFDEPTAALDPEITKEVAEIILQLGKTGITQVIVTHEVGFARRVATKVAYLEQGKLVEYGDAALLDHPQTKRLAEFLTH